MQFADDLIDEVRAVFGNASQMTEGTTSFVIVKGIQPLPGTEDERDVLLLPEPCDGYPSRLFFNSVILPQKRNWNGRRSFLERDWYAFSWNGIEPAGQRPLTLIRQHLRPLVAP